MANDERDEVGRDYPCHLIGWDAKGRRVGCRPDRPQSLPIAEPNGDGEPKSTDAILSPCPMLRYDLTIHTRLPDSSKAMENEPRRQCQR